RVRHPRRRPRRLLPPTPPREHARRLSLRDSEGRTAPRRARLMDEPLNLDVDATHMRRVFGMLTGYTLLPEGTHGYTDEFAELDLSERLCTLAAGRILWHLLAADAARHGAYDGVLEQALTESRTRADADFAILPGALHLAQDLDGALTLS